MAKAKTGRGVEHGSSSPMDDVLRVDRDGRNVYWNDFLQKRYYIPEDKVRQLSLYQNRTIFSVSLGAIVGALIEPWIGIALFGVCWAALSLIFYQRFLNTLAPAPEPKLSENERVLQEARLHRQRRSYGVHAGIGFVCCALIIYYFVSQGFSGPNLWASIALAAGCGLFGAFELAIYLRRR